MFRIISEQSIPSTLNRCYLAPNATPDCSGVALKHGLSTLSTVIVTRMASIVLFAVTTVRATPFRMSVMPTPPVMAAVVAALPVPIGRPIHIGIEFPFWLDDDGWSHSYARRRDHEWCYADVNFSVRLANDADDAEQQR